MSGNKHHGGLLKGRKFNGRHTTVIDPAVPLVSWAKSADVVKKVSLGKIVSVRTGPLRTTVQLLPAGVRVKVRGATTQQELMLYSDTPQLLELAMHMRFPTAVRKGA